MIELGYALRDHQPGGRMLLIFNAITGANEVPFDTTTFLLNPLAKPLTSPTHSAST